MDSYPPLSAVARYQSEEFIREGESYLKCTEKIDFRESSPDLFPESLPGALEILRGRKVGNRLLL